jgi:DNA-directed RNA polymerase subunit RPC12/RpoP
VLIECAECGGQVEETARRCPTCGNQTRYSKRMTATAIVVAVLLVAVGGFVWHSKVDSDRRISCLKEHAYEADPASYC